jgi:hypothetical protein
MKRHCLRSEQRGSHARQGGVLGAADLNPAFQWPPADDSKLIHDWFGFLIE